MFRSLIALVLLMGLAHPASAGGVEFLAEAKAAREAAKPNAALEAFTKAIKAGDLNNTDTAEAYRQRASIWATLGESTKGIADFTAALKLDPKLGPALALRGYLYGVIGNYGAAEKDQKAALALTAEFTSPRYKAWVLQLTADLARRRGDTKKALALLDEAGTLAPDYASVPFRRAWIYLDTGRKAEAKTEFLKFKKLAEGLSYDTYWPDERGAITRLSELL